MPATKAKSPKPSAEPAPYSRPAPAFSPTWQDAASFAARAHRHQVRKDNQTPYFAHVVRVAFTVSQVFGCDDPAAIAGALLHDTIEDTTTDYDDIRGRFGREIADFVAALTKNMALPEETREPEYDRRLSAADWRVKLIKLADTYDNFCDISSYPAEKRVERRKDGVEKCLRAIKIAQPDAGKHPCLRRAVQAVRLLISS